VSEIDDEVLREEDFVSEVDDEVLREEDFVSEIGGEVLREEDRVLREEDRVLFFASPTASLQGHLAMSSFSVR
jgi:hypothetical protein